MQHETREALAALLTALLRQGGGETPQPPDAARLGEAAAWEGIAAGCLRIAEHAEFLAERARIRSQRPPAPARSDRP